jgi:hypothetical protein
MPPLQKLKRIRATTGLGGKTAQLALAGGHAAASPDLFPEPEIFRQRIDNPLAAVRRRAARILEDRVNGGTFFSE